MITKKQGIAYAAITLDLLYKMKIKINPEIIAEQMSLVYDLYDKDEIENLYHNMIHNNKIMHKNISGRANCYVVNYQNSVKIQLDLARKFCGNNIELGKIYIAPSGENVDKYYELIQDIRNKSMDILLMNVYTILGISEREKNMIIHLCRKNKIVYVEI